MNVTVVSLEKCDATPATIALVTEVAHDMGVEINLEHIVVKTREDAIAYHHIGNPTVRINGLDIDPGARGINQFGITWRRYGASSMPSKYLTKAAFLEALNI